MALASNRNVFLGILIFTISLTLIWSFLPVGNLISRNGISLHQAPCVIYAPPPNASVEEVQVPQKRRRIAIASTFGHHFDVYMALAWTMERVLNQGTIESGSVEVYARSPFNFGFQDIIDRLGLYHGTLRNPEDLVQVITSNPGEGGIDLVVLGTCEIDLRGDWKKTLLEAWDARDDDHKFKLVCIVHNVQDLQWQSGIADWARRDAIRLLTISEHVAKSFQNSFDILADSTDPSIRASNYENIPIDVHVPILNITNIPEQQSRILSKAVIQGSFSTTRRDYVHIFSELIASLHQDPTVWGYLPLGDGPSFTVDSSLSVAPFHIYLIGSGSLTIPVELKNLVSMHTNLNYSEFYTLMSEMDICVPAFAENGYYEMQASSTFAMAVQCDVPILVTKRTRKSYTYADDNRLVVTRPAAMREIAALRALRTGDASDFYGNITGSHPLAPDSPVRGNVDDMMMRGWMRKKTDMQEVKEEIWMENEGVVKRLLRDL